MVWVLLIILIGALVFGPSLWVKSVMKRHSADRPDFLGTGSELERHILDKPDIKMML